MLRTATGEEVNTLKKLAKDKNIPISLVPAEKLNKLTRVEHQGVVAWTSLLEYVELQEGISHVVEQGGTPLFVMLDGVTDVRNVGAIARTALCCGAQALILPVSSSASLTEEAVKTSAGALNKILLCRTPSVQQAMDVLKLNGIKICGSHMDTNLPLHKADLTVPCCIVMGAEDKGISKEVIKRADELIHIPMSSEFDSLNVSVATGMMLYEAQRQRILE